MARASFTRAGGLKTAEPIVFSHAWPLRPAGQWQRYGSYADDLAVLMEVLDLRNAIMVGPSTGGGEVARYIARQVRIDE